MRGAIEGFASVASAAALTESAATRRPFMDRVHVTRRRTVELFVHRRVRELSSFVRRDVGTRGREREDGDESGEGEEGSHDEKSPTDQLFAAPAAAHAFMSVTAADHDVGPFGGMFPENHDKSERPATTIAEPVPLM